MKNIDEWSNDIQQGDVRETLREMPESSVHCVMTSPPYYGLRDYGTDGQIGLEDSLDEYIQTLVSVGKELRRVLRDDGSWWLNLGDSFAGSWGAQSKDETQNNLPQHDHPEKNPARNGQMRRKNKMLVPHRVAIALQESGWVVRSDAVWVKPNPMPSPVKDRFNECKEFVFYLTPGPDYWFDLDSVREPYAESTLRDAEAGYGWNADNKWNPEHTTVHREGGVNDSRSSRDDFIHPNGKNPGDVFEVTTKPFPEAHFAVYPPELCEKPIKASCPPTVCAECGRGYERDEEWTKVCDCETDETKAGVVVDPFAGAGTTCLVAKRLGRRFVGIELNKEYVSMAQKRVGVTVDDPDALLEEGETSLAAYTDGGAENDRGTEGEK